MEQVFDAEFSEKIGFSRETDQEDLWPGRAVLEIILKKIEFLSPGLTKKENIWDIEYFLNQRFGEERNKRRNQLKLPPKNKGT